jgi:hypothetical protein
LEPHRSHRSISGLLLSIACACFWYRSFPESCKAVNVTVQSRQAVASSSRSGCQVRSHGSERLLGQTIWSLCNLVKSEHLWSKRCIALSVALAANRTILSFACARSGRIPIESVACGLLLKYIPTHETYLEKLGVVRQKRLPSPWTIASLTPEATVTRVSDAKT